MSRLFGEPVIKRVAGVSSKDYKKVDDIKKAVIWQDNVIEHIMRVLNGDLNKLNEDIKTLQLNFHMLLLNNNKEMKGAYDVMAARTNSGTFFKLVPREASVEIKLDVKDLKYLKEMKEKSQAITKEINRIIGRKRVEEKDWQRVLQFGINKEKFVSHGFW